MEIRFLGPLGIVTGSCAWLRDEEKGWSFLVDCGLQQGERAQEEWNKAQWPFNPKDIKFVVLTHAHMDHCGLLPALYTKGFTGQVFCTRETAALATELLKDAAGHGDVPYTQADVERVRWWEPGSQKALGEVLPVADDLYLRFFRSGHIIGAVSVAVLWGPKGPEQRSMVFSGDLGPGEEDRENLPLLRFRMKLDGFDFAVVESTYGATVRSPSERDGGQRREKLRSLLDRTQDQMGVLVLPAFSLARTQDLLFDLHWLVAGARDKYQGMKFFLDAPLACRMHEAILEGLRRTDRSSSGKVRPRWLGKQMFRDLGLDDKNKIHIDRALDILRVALTGHAGDTFEESSVGNEIAQSWRPILTRIDNRKAFRQGELPTPCVILTSSGTCDGGPVSHWLPRLLGSEANTVALTGYCPATSIGGALLSLQDISLAERERDTQALQFQKGGDFPVANIRANIERIAGYSAHADQEDLLNWLAWSDGDRDGVAGNTVFIQHGEDRQRSALSVALKKRFSDKGKDVAVHMPSNPEQWWCLERKNEIVNIEEQREKRRIQEEIARLQNSLIRFG